MVTLEQAREHIGDRVVYTPIVDPHNEFHNPHVQPEEGWITSVGSKYIFVRYGTDFHSKATAPENLQFLNKEK
jgi:hypothetical protein